MSNHHHHPQQQQHPQQLQQQQHQQQQQASHHGAGGYQHHHPRSNMVRGNSPYQQHGQQGSYSNTAIAAETGSGPGAGGGTNYHNSAPRSGSQDHTYENLPRTSYSVKYPPSMDPRLNHPPRSMGGSGGPIDNPPPVRGSNDNGSRSNSQLISVADIINKLDFATSENVRLKAAIEENNVFFESKLQEFSQTQKNESVEKLEKEVKVSKGLVSSATNQFFEARVAVMGFKCRVMQLQGQLEERRSTDDISAAHQQEIDRFRMSNANLSKEVNSLKQRLSNDEGGGGGGDSGYIAQLKNQTKTLEEDRRQLMSINQRLEQDLESQQQERGHMTQEINQLHDQVREKDSHIQQLRSPRGQGGGARQASHDHTLQGQLQEMTVKKNALEGELSRVKQGHDNLLAKCKELQQSKDVIMNKLLATQQATSPTSANVSMATNSMATPPVPKPRDPDSRKLRDEIAQLQGELAELREERDKANKEKTGVEIMFQESSRKSQHLTEEKIRLEEQINSLQRQLEDEARKIRQLEEEKGAQMEGMMAEERWRVECEALRDSIRGMEKEKVTLTSNSSKLARELRACQEELEYVSKVKEESSEKNKQHKSKIAELTEKMAAMTTSSVSAEASPKSYTGTMKLNNLTARKLNDAMGQIKELELLKEDLEEKACEEREMAARKLRQVKLEKDNIEEELRVEREQSQKNNAEDASELKSEIDRLRGKEHHQKQHIRQLEMDQQASVEQCLGLRQEVDRYRQDMTIYDSEKRELGRKLSDRDREVAMMREELGEKDKILESSEAKKKDKLDNLQHSYTDLKSKHTQVIQDHRTELERKAADHQSLVSERTRILTEKDGLQTTCDEFQREAESVLEDYEACSQKLRVAQEDSSRWNEDYQKVNKLLAQQKERNGMLEDTRKELQEKLTHMDQQIKIYHEDFDRERNAREASVKVKNLAEERMKKMDRELKEVRERLNQHAANSLRNDPYDDGSYAAPLRTDPMNTRYSGPHQTSGDNYPTQPSAAGWHGPAPFPGPGGQGQQHQRRSGEHQNQRRSGEHLNYPVNVGGDGGGGGGGPPIHHREPSNARFGQGGGGGGGGEGPPIHHREPSNARFGQGGGGPHPRMGGPGGSNHHHTNAWTQQNPPIPPSSSSSSSHVPRYVNRTTMDPPGQRSRQDFSNPPLPPPPAIINDLSNPPPPPSRQQRPISGPHGGVNEGGAYPHGNNPLRAPNMELIGGGGTGHLGGPPLITLPGEVNNTAPPTLPCPICARDDFKTQTDLEVHSAQCVGQLQ